MKGSDMNTGRCFGALVLAASWYSLTWADLYVNQNVDGRANIYGAGRSGAAATPQPGGNGGGTVAPVFNLPTGSSRVLTFQSVTGLINYNVGNVANNGPDGATTFHSSMSSYQGISGITFSDRYGPLVGVFINGAPAGFADSSSGSNSPALTYNLATLSTTSFFPLLNQTFFIGDGLTGVGTGNGATQQFQVPNGATQLALGLSDGVAFNGPPGSYGDNGGNFTVTFAVTLNVLGDYNGDGVVNVADYVLWRKSPDTYGGNPAGYNTWRANFGGPPGSGAGGIVNGAVPEPATLVLLIFAAAGWCLSRRRAA
jgi:hypothetical protein